MNSQMKDMFLFDDDEIYAEAKKQIQECRKKKSKKLDLSTLDLKEIPPEIAELRFLEELDITCHNLKKVPEFIGNLKKLKYLNLGSVNTAKIPDSLGGCPLEHLEFYGNFSVIPETLGNCSKLKTIKFLSGKPISLPDSFGKLSSLNELEIRAPALEIPESFGKLSSLKNLSLVIEKELVLPKSFGGLCALEDIWIVSPHMRRIPDSTGNCKNLKLIIIDSDKLAALPESFCKLKNLQELHLDTFALKTLPAAFGSLTSLKSLDIFSGALTAFPESMGGLKKLVRLSLDAHNVKELPVSFKKLSYIKDTQIEIGQSEPVLARKKGKVRKNAPLSFEELLTMSWRYRGKLFETYSIKQLETLLCSAPTYPVDAEDRKLFRDIMIARSRRLRGKFKWTEENKKRIVKVSDESFKAWEDGFTRAKMIIETLYKKEKNKKSFNDKYSIDITLYPEVLFDDDDYENSDWKLYNVITAYLNSEIELNIRIKYDPVTKNDDDFRKNIHIKRDLSWNIEGFGDIDLEGYHICYALHILYSHNNWAFSDIPRINSIYTKIKVNCDGENF